MSLKKYISLMIFGTVLCWIAFGLVVNNFDPDQQSWLVFAFFYTTLFLALVGSFALVGMIFRLYILRHDVVFRQVVIAFRQGLSFSFLVIAALFLESQKLLFWWNLLFLIVA